MNIHDYSEEEKEIINWFKKDRELYRLSFLFTFLILPIIAYFCEQSNISFGGHGPFLSMVALIVSIVISFREFYLLNKQKNNFCELMAKRMGFEVYDTNTTFVEMQCYEMIDPKTKTLYTVSLGNYGVLVKQINTL